MRTYKKDIPDDYVFSICDRFFRLRHGAAEIQKWLESEGFRGIKRPRIYPLLSRGVQLGYVQLCAPFERRLEQELATIYPQAASDINVVNIRYGDLRAHADDAQVVDLLAAAGARKAIALIKQLGKDKKQVGICFAAGRTAEAFARQFAFLLRSEGPDNLPRLSLHAMSPGFSPVNSRTPVTFFSYFDSIMVDEYVGLFCPAMVAAKDHKTVINEPGAHEAFERRNAVDLIVTSLESADEKHGRLFHALSESKLPQVGRTKKLLEDRGWIGEVHWCPYSESGPIALQDGYRAVSLFDIPELVELAKAPGKHVILIAGPSPSLRTKAKALRPLMLEPTLRVFNHLITDVPTAMDLLRS